MKLLVSVRNLEEAHLAISAGVDLLDLKEPSLGSLGAADPTLWQSVAELAAGTVPLSAALGELADYTAEALAARCQQAGGLSYAKIGLAGTQDRSLWLQRWKHFAASLPAGAQPVAVAYADAEAAQSPPVQEVLEQAGELRWRTLLIDTFDKQSGNLLRHLAPAQLEQVVARAISNGLVVVLAGSLDFLAIRRLARLSHPPHYVAVRGAVCPQGRAGPLDGRRIAALRELLESRLPSILPQQ